MKKMFILFMLLMFNACSVAGDKTAYMTSDGFENSVNSSEEQIAMSKSGRPKAMNTYTFTDYMQYTGAIYKPYVVVYPIVEISPGCFALFNNDQINYPISSWVRPGRLPDSTIRYSYFIPKNGQTTVEWPSEVTHFVVYIMDTFYTSINRISLGLAKAQSGSDPWYVQKLQDSTFPESREFAIRGTWKYKIFFTTYKAKIIRTFEM
ncbi:MAG: hypothetical protein ACRCTQ_00210 [Brevinemataceae bacterium]